MRRLAVPELRALRDLRHTLARGGIPPIDKRTPEDHARLTAFRTLQELLQLVGEFERRIAAGERCRIVEREHPHKPSGFVLEFAIEVQP